MLLWLLWPLRLCVMPDTMGNRPKRIGASKMPARISPMTLGCLSFTNNDPSNCANVTSSRSTKRTEVRSASVILSTPSAKTIRYVIPACAFRLPYRTKIICFVLAAANHLFDTAEACKLISRGASGRNVATYCAFLHKWGSIKVHLQLCTANEAPQGR